MNEAMLPTDPPEVYLATMLRVVVVLLQQHNDHLKIGDGSPHLTIGYLLKRES